MHQLWPQTDLGSNLDSTSATISWPTEWGWPWHLPGGAKGMKDNHICKALDM